MAIIKEWHLFFELNEKPCESFDKDERAFNLTLKSEPKISNGMIHYRNERKDAIGWVNGGISLDALYSYSIKPIFKE